MKAIILAAGRGSRMAGATADRPKCLVEFAGRSLLSRQMAALRGVGISAVAAVRGYRGSQLEGFGLDLFDNPRWADTNMVASLLEADAWLTAEACVVSYSDIFYTPETVRVLASCPADIAISYDPDWLSLWSRRFTDPLSDAETFRLDASSNLLEIGGRAETTGQIQGQYMGLLKFTPAGWANIRALVDGLPKTLRDRLDMTGMLSRLLAGGQQIAAVPVIGPWGEIDSESDLALYDTPAASPTER